MHRGEDEVLFRIDRLSPLDCMIAPYDKDKMFPFRCQMSNNRFGKWLRKDIGQ